MGLWNREVFRAMAAKGEVAAGSGDELAFLHSSVTCRPNAIQVASR